MADGEVKDLRSMVAEATDAAEASAVTPAKIPAREARVTPEPEAKTEEVAVTEPSSGGRQRGADGRFLPKDGETQEDAEAAEAANAQPAAKPELKAEPVSTEPAGTVEAPEHWSSSDKKWFSTLPLRKQQSYADRYKETGSPSEVPLNWSAGDKEWIGALPDEVKASVIDRFKQLESGFTPRLQRLAQIEKDYGEAMQLFAPHEHTLRSRGQTPSDVIKVYTGMEEALTRAKFNVEQGRDDPQGAAVVARIIQSYKVDPAQVAAYLQGTAPQQHQNGTVQNGYSADPALLQKVQEIEQTVTSWQRQQSEGKQAEARSQIERFAQEKNPDGSLKNPYFSELESVITELAQFEQSQGRSIDLPTLYKRAVRLDDSTYQRELSSQRQADEKRVAEERRAKTEAAKRASSSVSGAPSPGATSQRTSSSRGVRDSLVAAFEEIEPVR